MVRTSTSAKSRFRRRLAAVALLWVGCMPKGADFDPLDVVMPRFTNEEEREVGFAFDRALQEQVQVIDDPLVAGFLNDLGRTILVRAEPQPFVYRFRLIRDPTLNAFAVFGGYVYFHTGTLMAVGSVDELAGVMGHEIAHVRLGHHRKLQERAQLPDILATLAGIGAAVATGEPGAIIAAQGINVALQLRFSREFEAEADYEGTRYMAEAGFDPLGISHFFEKLIKGRRRDPDRIPPYLFSHPDVEKRVEAVKLRAQALPPGPPHNDDFAEPLRRAQARLAQLAAGGGARVIAGGDPAALFASGEQALADGHPDRAVAYYQRTAELDPTRALVFMRLGEAYEGTGSVQQAVYAYEQALRRAGRTGTLAQKAERRIERLNFTVLEDPKLSLATSARGEPELVWTAALGPRFRNVGERLQVHWFGPDGAPRSAQPVAARGVRGSARLVPVDPAPGRWVAEARLDDVRVDRRSVTLP